MLAAGAPVISITVKKSDEFVISALDYGTDEILT
jgi:hypothetical protein